jgi:molybdate transport system regulatory protein
MLQTIVGQGRLRPPASRPPNCHDVLRTPHAAKENNGGAKGNNGGMRLSIRNQLDGVIDTVTPGEVMGTIGVRLTGGQQVTAAITLEAVQDLGLAAGQPVTVLIKSTDVALATGPVNGLSIRNQLTGRVTAVDAGAVMTTVKVAIAGGATLTSAITKESGEDLGLSDGVEVTVLVKSTEVAIGRD